MTSDELVKAVLKAHKAGDSCRAIAEKYGISKSKAANIIAGKVSTKVSTKSGENVDKKRGQKRGQKLAREPDEKGAALVDGKHDEKVLQMFLDQGLSQAEIARQTGLKSSYVSRVISRNRGQQRKLAIGQQTVSKYDARIVEERAIRLQRQLDRMDRMYEQFRRVSNELDAIGLEKGMREWKAYVDSILAMHHEERVLVGFIEAGERERNRLSERKLELEQKRTQEQVQSGPATVIQIVSDGSGDTVEDYLV